MADVQKHFEKFHERIRVDYDMSSELREKRDIIVEKVKKHLRDNGLPGCEQLLQGSYKMKTGTRPVADLEYDIDIGLRFGFHETDYTAKAVRKWVYEAVKDHTIRVEDRGPCIRVVYQKGYHLDLVCYAAWEDGGVDLYRLAHKADGWRPADPPALLSYVKKYREGFAGTEDGATKTDQFRRCVRYLRRWNDERTPYEDAMKPTGIAYVLLAIRRGLSKRLRLDESPDDQAALAAFVTAVAQTYGRVEAWKPTPEYEDVFARLDGEAMDKFKADLGVLAATLEEASRTADPVDACEKLRGVFGNDFPVPPPTDSARASRAPAIITSSTSA